MTKTLMRSAAPCSLWQHKPLLDYYVFSHVLQLCFRLSFDLIFGIMLFFMSRVAVWATRWIANRYIGYVYM